LTGLTGIKASPLSPTEELDVAAVPVFGKAYRDLEPYQQRQIEQANPDLYLKKVQASTPEAQMAHQTRQRLLTEQLASDERLKTGELSYGQWKDDLGKRKDEQRAILGFIYRDQVGRKDNPMNDYFAIITKHERPDGTVNWDAVEADVAQFSPEQRAYIDRNTNLGGTEMQQKYENLKRQARPLMSEFMDTPAYLGLNVEEGQQVQHLLQEAQSYQQTFPQGTMSLRVAVAKVARDRGITGKILATALNADRLRNPRRSLYWRQHPVLEQVYGDLSPFQNKQAA
jgi:hypothetical protein